MKVSATSAVDLVYQPLDNQHFGLRVNLRHVVRGKVAVDVKVRVSCRVDWSCRVCVGSVRAYVSSALVKTSLLIVSL